MERDGQRFSYLVEEYFTRRGTYPIVLAYKCPVTEVDLEQLQNTLFTTYHKLADIEVIATELARGDYWAGVLIELSDDTFHDTDDTWANDIMEFEASEERSAHRPAHAIHGEHARTSHEKTTGFSAGTSVYSCVTLETLGRDYFRRGKQPSV